MNLLSKPLALLAMTVAQLINGLPVGESFPMTSMKIGNVVYIEPVWNSEENQRIRRATPQNDNVKDINKELDAKAKEHPKTHYAYHAGFNEAKAILVPKISQLQKDLENSQNDVRKFKGFTWKIVPRVYFDDIESLYKSKYDKYNDDRRNEETQLKQTHNTSKGTNKLTYEYVPLYTKPADYPDARDPRAVRMRQKADFWDWLTIHHADEDVINKILENMEKKFRSMQKPPIPEKEVLTDEQKEKLERFRKKTCRAIGFALESASFVLQGHQAVELFEGELEDLNIYGEEVDPYLVPVLNAVAPLTKKGVEPATFMKTE